MFIWIKYLVPLTCLKDRPLSFLRTLHFWPDLRVVQTQAILFLKSMSERVGSDIERLRILSDVIFKDVCIQIDSRSKSEPSLSDIDFKNEMALVWTTLNHRYSSRIYQKQISGRWRWKIDTFLLGQDIQVFHIKLRSFHFPISAYSIQSQPIWYVPRMYITNMFPGIPTGPEYGVVQFIQAVVQWDHPVQIKWTPCVQPGLGIDKNTCWRVCINYVI